MMRLITRLGLFAVMGMLPLLTACGGQYSSPACTYNATACTEPAAWTCCSMWGFPYHGWPEEYDQK